MPEDAPDSLSLLCKRLGIEPSAPWPQTLADIMNEIVRRIEEIEKRDDRRPV